MIRATVAFCALLMPLAVTAQNDTAHNHTAQNHSDQGQNAHIHGQSPYAGLEAREIKSLSATDLDELRRGAGWGLALAAELNGVPGPAHLLELRDDIGLSADQVAKIETIFDAMQADAKASGARFIAAEQAIEAAFRAGDLEPDSLRALIDASAQARAALRYSHLLRHLETPPLLSAAQITRYNDLRGYGTASPCDAVPEGHDPTMWRRHNGCGD